jgi:hypothetical protein
MNHSFPAFQHFSNTTLSGGVQVDQSNNPTRATPCALITFIHQETSWFPQQNKQRPKIRKRIGCQRSVSFFYLFELFTELLSCQLTFSHSMCSLYALISSKPLLQDTLAMHDLTEYSIAPLRQLHPLGPVDRRKFILMLSLASPTTSDNRPIIDTRHLTTQTKRRRCKRSARPVRTIPSTLRCPHRHSPLTWGYLWYLLAVMEQNSPFTVKYPTF